MIPGQSAPTEPPTPFVLGPSDALTRARLDPPKRSEGVVTVCFGCWNKPGPLRCADCPMQPPPAPSAPSPRRRWARLFRRKPR